MSSVRRSAFDEVDEPGRSSIERIEIAGVDGDLPKLEELVDKNALREAMASYERLFGVPISVISSKGNTLAGAIDPHRAALCALVNERPEYAAECAAIRAELAMTSVGAANAVTVPCFTGARYWITPITYDRRAIGRIVVGPFVPGEQRDPPRSLLSLLSEDSGRARDRWSAMPRISEARAEEIGAHLATVLDVIIFSGHRALLTSQMHLATMRESYRELCEKNERLEEAYERLKELDRLKSNFLATVSHELRTPLTSIMGYGEMLAEGVAGKLNDEQHEFVDTIRSKSEQLLGLIMSLLDLSRLENGTMAVRPMRLSIGGVLEESISTLAPTAMKKEVTLTLDVANDLPPVLGDADRLRQVFVNLTDNAVKFTPEGGRVAISARLTLEKPPLEPGLVLVAPMRPVVEIRVADTGIGVPEDERERVFDPFYQVDQSSTREFGGAGLGLSIVKRLIEAHHGNIRVEANDPTGAVFVVTLPAARSSLLPPSRRGGSIPPMSSPLPPVFG